MAPKAVPGKWGGLRQAYCFNDQQSNQVFKKHAILFRIGPTKERERFLSKYKLWQIQHGSRFSVGVSRCTTLGTFATAIPVCCSQWAWGPFKSIFLERRKGNRLQAQQARAILNHSQ